MKPVKTEVLYSTPWCEVVAKTMRAGEEPWYSMRGPDYTTIVALTEENRVLAVRQYRPAVEQFVIEFPAGNIDRGESPEQCARRELVEETGYEAGEMELLGPMFPDVGRLGTRVWPFFAPAARPVKGWKPEPDVEVLTYSLDELVRAIGDGTFNHALHLAALVPAMLRGKLVLGVTS
ncbi:MAG TPA: NUDIX hydrolase [Bryobacteraceae bacterium]|nr:NUDIX hydrolase [Bryobacteraceae bacterium]